MNVLKILQRGIVANNKSGQRIIMRAFASQQDFEKAAKDVKTLNTAPDNNDLLKLYALFKQGSIGKCTTPKPGMMDFVGKAKWEAWSALGELSQDEARQKYVDYVNGLISKDKGTSGVASSSSDTVVPGLDVERRNGVCYITLNRPNKRNALTNEMYDALTRTLNEVSEDVSIKFAVVSGTGDFFCAGNDLGNFQAMAARAGGDMKKAAQIGSETLEPFVGAFINFKKPLVGLVQGPAIGVSVTTLGLYDTVYASDRAYFTCPFSSLGQSPEGCSSYTFPRMMGHAKVVVGASDLIQVNEVIQLTLRHKPSIDSMHHYPLHQANEFLMFGARWSAETAKDRGLVTEVFPHDTFADETQRRVDEWAKLPPLDLPPFPADEITAPHPTQSLAYSKQLVCDETVRATLHRVNRAECQRLVERWTSDECVSAIMAFMNKSKI